MILSGARIGAVMFLLTVAMTVPPSPAAAWADTGDTDVSAASSSPAAPPRAARGAGAPRKSAQATGNADRPPVIRGRAASALPAAPITRQPLSASSRAVDATGPAPGPRPENPTPIEATSTAPAIPAVLPDLPIGAATPTPIPLSATGALPRVRGAEPVNRGLPGAAASITPSRAVAAWSPADSLTPAAHVRGFFDSATEWLSDLPAGPVAEFLQGALLLIRRTLFNETPAAKPPPAAGPADGPITGSLDAVDPEGDPVTYTLTAAPTHGSVTLHDDGTYTYTPDPGFEGVDTFTVSVTDTGWHVNLLQPLLPSPVDAVVTVEVGDIPPRVSLGNPYESYAPPEGCACQQTWSYMSVTITGGKCANPDSDPRGPWCRLESSPDGRTWSYCTNDPD